jgi:hypothetical protein
MQVTTIGLDIAKNVFQVHGIDAAEKVVVRKQLRRRQVLEFFKALPSCLVGMEACATAHYWARELTKLGHQVRLMPAKDVKAYVKRNKNDAADAEAICEAVRRPTMRFVQIKSTEQQGRLMLHRARDLLMRQRTQVINAMRAHLAELGIVGGRGGACQQDGAHRQQAEYMTAPERFAPGRCWPRATPIGCPRLRQRRKESGDGRMRLRLASVRSRTAGVMTALMRNGRDRRLGEPVMGHAILERVLLFGTRSADYIRTSGHNGCIATEVTLQALIVRFLLHRGHRPYMTHNVTSPPSNDALRKIEAITSSAMARRLRPPKNPVGQ